MADVVNQLRTVKGEALVELRELECALVEFRAALAAVVNSAQHLPDLARTVTALEADATPGQRRSLQQLTENVSSAAEFLQSAFDELLHGVRRWGIEKGAGDVSK